MTTADELHPPQHPPSRWPRRRPLDRPLRWLVAAAEVVAAVALASVTVWAWHRALVPVQLPEYQNPAIPRTVSRMAGPWAALSVGAATVAGVLVLDAIRQAVLAARARPGAREAARPPAELATGDTDRPSAEPATGDTARPPADLAAGTPVEDAEPSR